MKTCTVLLVNLLLLLVLGCQLEDPDVPIARAIPSTVSCAVPCTVTFTDASEKTSIYTWNYQWDFGDGTVSSEKNPAHTYTRAGQYNVVYTLSGKYGTSRDSSVTISVLDDSPMAGFTMTGGNCTAPCEVTFTNASKNATSYLWNFGDKSSDSISTAANPKHIYTKGGKFVVTLTVTNGAKSNVKRDTVTIKSAVVLVADFNFTQDTTHADSTVVIFKNLSSNATTYLWEFGDGKASNLKDPVHAYKKEVGKDTIYTIKLQASANGTVSQKLATLTIKKK